MWDPDSDLSLLQSLIALGLATLLGLAAHRASICSVAAVEEVMMQRRFDMLVAFVKTALWVIGVTLLLSFFVPETVKPVGAYRLSITAMAGGLIFGIGAAVNHGCAFSMLRRLSDGQVVFVLSLAGFAGGLAVHRLLFLQWPSLANASVEPLIDPTRPITMALLSPVFLWMAWEVFRLIKNRGDSRRTRTMALSMAAALMGLTNGVLYALLGTWMYTGVAARQIEFTVGHGDRPHGLFWLLFAGLLGGMFISAFRTKRFRWRPSMKTWSRNFGGGLLMGFGAGMVPGGNDVVLLHAIPGYSPHGIPVFLAMLLGIGIALTVIQRLQSGGHEKPA